MLAWSYVGLAAALAVLLALLRNTSYAAVPLMIVGVGSTCLILLGSARNGPSVRRP